MGCRSREDATWKYDASAPSLGSQLTCSTFCCLEFLSLHNPLPMPQLRAKQGCCKDPSATGAGSGRPKGKMCVRPGATVRGFCGSNVLEERGFAVPVSLERGRWVIRGPSPRSRGFRNSSPVSPKHAGQASLRQPKA